MKKITIQLDEQLLADARLLAAKTNQTLDAIIENALRQSLPRHQQSGPKKPIRLKTFKGTGLKPGINLDNSSELLNQMEFS